MNVRKSLLILLLTSANIPLKGIEVEELSQEINESTGRLTVDEIVSYISQQAPLLDMSGFNLKKIQKELVKCNRFNGLPAILRQLLDTIHDSINSPVKAISAQDVDALCGYLQNVDSVEQVMPHTVKMLNSLYEKGQEVSPEIIVNLLEENQEQVEKLYGINRTIFEDVGTQLRQIGRASCRERV